MRHEKAGGVALRCALGLALALGCGGPDAEVEAPEEDGILAAEAEAEEPEPEAVDAEANRDAEGDENTESDATGRLATPVPGFEEPELRTYGLLLVNPGGRDAVVHASAGAGSVVLDTVRAGDSVRVNVEVRSDRLLLEASDPDGRRLGSEEIEPSAEELSRWEVPGTSP